MEQWSDTSEDSERFVQYLDNLDWKVFVELLPRRKSDKEISKSDVYQTIFLPKIRPKADPNLLF